MWFVFGIVTAITAFVISLMVRLQSRWVGTTQVAPDGTRYLYSYSDRQYRHQPLLRIGMSTRAGCRFVVREETGVDRRFKSIGIAQEFRSGIRTFDERFYLESDDPRIGVLLRESAAFRELALEIQETTVASGAQFSCIRCARHRIWVEMHPRKGWNGPDHHANLLAGKLKTLSVLLSDELSHTRARDPFVVRASLLLSFSTALAVGGGMMLLELWREPTTIIDPTAPLRYAAVPALFALAAFIVLVLIVLGRGSRTHLVVTEAMLVGGFGFLSWGYALVHHYNISYDDGPVQIVELGNSRSDGHRNWVRRRGHQNRYYLDFTDWRNGSRGETLSVGISSQVHFDLGNSERILLHYRTGALGIPWIQRVVAE